MNNTTTSPETIRSLFAQIDASEIMDTHIDYRRITRRCNLVDLEAYLKRNGYRLKRQGNNVYGWIKVVPITETTPAPVLRLITRSDHVAVTGSLRSRA